MRTKRQPRLYVVETNGKALVAFEAVSGREANELLKEGWFRDELLSLRSDTQQVWDGSSVLTTRIGNDAEIAQFKSAADVHKGQGSDGIFLAYLISLDGTA